MKLFFQHVNHEATIGNFSLVPLLSSFSKSQLNISVNYCCFRPLEPVACS